MRVDVLIGLVWVEPCVDDRLRLGASLRRSLEDGLLVALTAPLILASPERGVVASLPGLQRLPAVRLRTVLVAGL